MKGIETTLQNSETAADVLGTFPDLFIRIDFNGIIRDYNAGDADDFISLQGNKVDGIFPPGIMNKVLESIFHAVRYDESTAISYAAGSGSKKKYYRARFIPSVNEQILITIHEIKKSRNIKKALANSRKRLKTVWDNSSDGMRLLNREGKIVAVNNSFCKLIEKKSDELIGFSAEDACAHIIANDPGKFIFNFEKQFRERKIHASYEEKLKFADGRIKYVEVVNTFVSADESETEDDESALLLSIFRDITNKKNAQQIEKLFEQIVDTSHEAIIGISTDGAVKSWNSGAEKIFGYSKKEIIDQPVLCLVHPEFAEKFQNVLGTALAGKGTENFETACLTKSIQKIFVSAAVSPIKSNSGNTLGISIIANDITRNKRIEQTLLETQERYRSLFETSPDAIVLVNPEGKILMGNRLLFEMFGFDSVEEIIGRNIFRHIKKEDRKHVLNDANELFEAGRIVNSEYSLLKKNGESFPAEISASIIVNKLGMPDKIISVIRDITERKAAESKLKNSEMRFRSIWENSNDGMRLTDENGNIAAVNKAYCRLVETEEHDLIGKPFNTVYSNTDYINESLTVYKKNFAARSFKTHKHSRSSFNCGKTLDLDVTYSMIEFETGRPLLLAIFRDVTERKKVEEELRKNEKHAAIGKMAAYLSHEIKTPLASIKMNIDMLSRELIIPKEKQKSFSIIQKEVKRLNQLLKNVLQFSREVDLVFVRINLFTLVNNICQLLKPVLDEKHIRFINNVRQVYIKGDYLKLQTVLHHLVENSIQAINGKGIIEISSAENKKDNRVSVFIKDNGSGIKLPGQIFDPFFTTKASGTGLGLSIAQKIIEQHDGRIVLVSSKPGETIFEIQFFNN